MITPASNIAVTGFSQHPYPGLRPFARDEADIFFGRQEQISQLLAKLAANRFVTILGNSGSGKSSLVQAGLIPALEAGMLPSAGSRWVSITMRPGNSPIENLAKALLATPQTGQIWSRYTDASELLTAVLRRGPDGIREILKQGYLVDRSNLLVVVDQFEELFRYHNAGDIDQSIEFVNLLLSASQQKDYPVYIVLTMRSDFTGECSLFRGLPEAINQGHFLVPRLTRDQCREAIVGPAAAFGVTIEERLITQILNDMQSDPDQLPLMQHILQRMWNEQAHEKMQPLQFRLQDYIELGGLENAISKHADEIYDRLSPLQQAIAARLFQCLTERVDGNRDSRRPIRFEKLVEIVETNRLEFESEPPELPLQHSQWAAELIEVLNVFRAADCNFLVPSQSLPISSNTIIDISHESLIRQWKQLRIWVEAEYQAGQTYRRMLETAKLWQIERAALWRTPDLETGLNWSALGLGPRWAERYGGDYEIAIEFLQKSQQEQQRLDQAKQTQIARELSLIKQAAARLRLLLYSTAAICALTFTAALVTYSLWQNQEKLRSLADQARENATKQTTQLQNVNALLSSIISDIDPYNSEGAVDLRAQMSERLAVAGKQLQASLTAENDDNLRVEMLLKIAHAMNHMGADHEALQLLEPLLSRLNNNPKLNAHRIVDCRNQLLECKGFRPQQTRLDFAKDTMDLAISLLTERSPLTLTSMSNYAQELRSAKQHYQAREVDTRVLVQRRKILGEKHPQTLLSIQSLALDYENLLLHTKAIELYQSAIELRKSSTDLNGNDHFDLLYCRLIESLSRCYSSLAWPERAIPLEQELRSAYEKYLGSDHPLTLRCYSHLCENYKQRKQYSAAMDMADRIAQKFELKLGSDDPETLAAKARLAQIRFDIGDLKASRDLFKFVFERRRSILGLYDVSTLEALCDMAKCNSQLREPNENIGSLNDVLASCSVLYGPDHEATKYLHNRVRGDYVVQERQTAAQAIYGIDWCPSNLASKFEVGREFPKVACSFVSAYDKLETVHDGIVDFRLTQNNRWTTYQSPNVEDWLEVDFGKEQRVSKVALYFYEDGGVTPPKSFRLSYQTDVADIPYVEITPSSISPKLPASNVPNIVIFPEINARKLRITLAHQDETRSGLTEVFVSNEKSPDWILHGDRSIAGRLDALKDFRLSPNFDKRDYLILSSKSIDTFRRNEYYSEAIELASAAVDVRGETFESIGSFYDLFSLQYQLKRYSEARMTVDRLIKIVEAANRPEELENLKIIRLIIDIQIGENLPKLYETTRELWSETPLVRSHRYNLVCAAVQLGLKMERGSQDEKQQAKELFDLAAEKLKEMLEENGESLKSTGIDPDIAPLLKHPKLQHLIKNSE